MLITIFIVLLIITSIQGAYTMCFQDTTLEISKRISPMVEKSFLGTPIAKNIQNVITPRQQVLNNTIYFCLLFLSVIFTVFLFKWYFVICTVIGILSINSPLKRLFPKSESLHYLRIIRKDMLKRLETYQRRGDSEKIELMSFFIEQFDNVTDNKPNE